MTKEQVLNALKQGNYKKYNSIDLNGSKWYYNREWNLSENDGFRVVDLVESEC